MTHGNLQFDLVAQVLELDEQLCLVCVLRSPGIFHVSEGLFVATQRLLMLPHLLVSITERLLADGKLDHEGPPDVITHLWRLLPHLLTLALGRLLDSARCLIFLLRKVVVLEEVVNGFLWALLQQIILTANKVRVLVLRVQADDLRGCIDGTVMLSNSPLHDGFQEQAELLTALRRCVAASRTLHYLQLEELVRSVRAKFTFLPRRRHLHGNDLLEFRDGLMIATLVHERQRLEHLQLNHELELSVLNLSHLHHDRVALSELIRVLLNHQHKRIVFINQLVEGALKTL